MQILFFQNERSSTFVTGIFIFGRCSFRKCTANVRRWWRTYNLRPFKKVWVHCPENYSNRGQVSLIKLTAKKSGIFKQMFQKVKYSYKVVLLLHGNVQSCNNWSLRLFQSPICHTWFSGSMLPFFNFFFLSSYSLSRKPRNVF